MSDDDAPLKSAYDLAMERLQRQDRAEGAERRRPLTEKQKVRIADLRSKAEAKLAEIEIMLRKEIAGAQGDPTRIQQLREEHEIDRRRAESHLEDEIARVRAEG